MPLSEVYPQFMENALKTRWQQLLSLYGDDLERQEAIELFSPLFIEELVNTWVGSDFAAEEFIKKPDFLFYFYDLWLAGGQLSVSTDYHYKALAQWLQHVESEQHLMMLLRQYRNREMVRIIWRDLNRLGDTQQTTQDLSTLADACIEHTLHWLYQDIITDFGVPHGSCEQKNKPQKMVVLAMGKLGAGELNLSSDVDLMFTYPDQGETLGGRRTLSNQEFFIRLGQRLIKVLDVRTSDGFVFRVDMRLRPYGSSGALAMSFSAMEQYYQDQGRDWERYAMIKARAVTEIHEGESLLERLRPFVYRRYLDFGAIEALRDMKRLIQREVSRKGMQKNIKLGSGGIREIEFIVQSFQLIHGGKDRVLQQKALLDVLPILDDKNYLSGQATSELKEAYLFLRDIEHALQAVKDEQTQSLPETDYERARLSYSMGFASWALLLVTLEMHRDNVARQFNCVVSDSESNNEPSQTSGQWRMLWLNELNDSEELELLANNGFEDPKSSLRLLLSLRDGKMLSHVRRQSRERVDKIMPILLEVVFFSEQPDIALARVLPLVESVLRRTAYLVLLIENPAALEHLCKLCVASRWVAEQIACTPSLLDEFLHLGLLYKPPMKDELNDELKQQMTCIPESDLELQMEALRYFKISHILRVTAAHVVGTLPLMKESDYMTWIAEVLLAEVVNIAWQNMTERHGKPRSENGELGEPGFIIIAYGKLGGIELGPGSDLDLVFVHNDVSNKETEGPRKIDSTTFYLRLSQRIIHILTTNTLSGALYDVDMRLRPSGSSGLLASSISAYEKYQQNDAWTWEQQALVRARVVTGDKALTRKFEQLRENVLSQKRDVNKLRHDVVNMRTKMRSHGKKSTKGMFNIKHDFGGIVDIEFLMQYAVLRYSAFYPNLMKWTDNIRISEQLEAAGLLDAEDAENLRETYKQLRLMVHKQKLQNEKSLVSEAKVVEYIDTVQRLWKQWMLPQEIG